jgi:hypothetical protein
MKKRQGSSGALKVRTRPVHKCFSGTPLENSGGAENSAENSGPHGRDFWTWTHRHQQQQGHNQQQGRKQQQGDMEMLKIYSKKL